MDQVQVIRHQVLVEKRSQRAVARARIAYDNLRPAVTKALVGGARLLTPRFAAMTSHYLLEPCFCWPGEGHDKGGVEARGKAIRTQVLVPISSAPTLDAINAALLAQLLACGCAHARFQKEP